MWLEHCYCYFQPVFSAILLKSRKAQVFRYSLLTEYGQDKRLLISNLWRNGFRLSLNFRRCHCLINESTLIFVAVFVTLTKLSKLSSQFSSTKIKMASSMKIFVIIFISEKTLIQTGTKAQAHTHRHTHRGIYTHLCNVCMSVSQQLLVNFFSALLLLLVGWQAGHPTWTPAAAITKVHMPLGTWPYLD